MLFRCASQLMVVKITSKWELRRLCGAVNATALVRLGPPTPEEAGYVDLAEVSLIRICLLFIVLFQQPFFQVCINTKNAYCLIKGSRGWGTEGDCF